MAQTAVQKSLSFWISATPVMHSTLKIGTQTVALVATPHVVVLRRWQQEDTTKGDAEYFRGLISDKKSDLCAPQLVLCRSNI